MPSGRRRYTSSGLSAGQVRQRPIAFSSNELQPKPGALRVVRCSLMLPDRSRLRLLESGPRFAAVSANRGDRCPASGGQGIARREAQADARALGEEGGVLPPRGLSGGFSKRWPAVSNEFFFAPPQPHSGSLLLRRASDPRIARAPATSQVVIKSGHKEFCVLNGLEWIVLTAAVLGVFVVGDLVLCRGQAYSRQFMGRPWQRRP